MVIEKDFSNEFEILALSASNQESIEPVQTELGRELVQQFLDLWTFWEEPLNFNGGQQVIFHSCTHMHKIVMQF